MTARQFPMPRGLLAPRAALVGDGGRPLAGSTVGSDEASLVGSRGTRRTGPQMRTHRRILVIGDGCRRPASGCRQAEGFEGPAEIVAVQSRWTRAAIGQAFPRWQPEVARAAAQCTRFSCVHPWQLTEVHRWRSIASTRGRTQWLRASSGIETAILDTRFGLIAAGLRTA